MCCFKRSFCGEPGQQLYKLSLAANIPLFHTNNLVKVSTLCGQSYRLVILSLIDLNRMGESIRPSLFRGACLLHGWLNISRRTLRHPPPSCLTAEIRPSIASIPLHQSPPCSPRDSKRGFLLSSFLSPFVMRLIHY